MRSAVLLGGHPTPHSRKTIGDRPPYRFIVQADAEDGIRIERRFRADLHALHPVKDSISEHAITLRDLFLDRVGGICRDDKQPIEHFREEFPAPAIERGNAVWVPLPPTP